MNIMSTGPQITSVQNCFTAPASTGPRHTTGSVSFSVRRFNDMASIPVLLKTGYMPASSAVARVRRPNALGMDGPVISASNTAVLSPCRFASTARSDVTSDFPTPPFPLITPTTRLMWLNSCGFSKKLFCCVRSEQLLAQLEQLCVQSFSNGFSSLRHRFSTCAFSKRPAAIAAYALLLYGTSAVRNCQ